MSNRRERRATGADPIKQQAADWFVEFESANESEGSTPEAWHAWSADPNNQAEYDKLVRIRHQLRFLTRPGPVNDLDLLRDKAPPNPGEQHRQAHRPGVAWRGHFSRWWTAYAAVLIPLTVVALWLTARWREAPHVPVTLAYTTPVGLQRTITLQDGSKLILEGDTRITLRLQAARDIYLERGGASFDVRHDPLRPFIVHAVGADIQAIGTHFVVHRYSRYIERVRVWVTEGTVQVEPTSTGQSVLPTRPAIRLTQNEELAYDSGGGQLSPLKVDPASIPDPAQRFFMYRDRPLVEVIEDLQRYTSIHLTIDPAVARLRFTGSVMAQHAERWVLGLPEIFPTLEIESQKDSIRIRSRIDTPPVAFKSAQR